MDLRTDFPFINPNTLNYITQRMIDYYKEDGDLLGDDIDLNTNEIWQRYLMELTDIYEEYVLRVIFLQLPGQLDRS